jgi:hypothetical protein
MTEDKGFVVKDRRRFKDGVDDRDSDRAGQEDQRPAEPEAAEDQKGPAEPASTDSPGPADESEPFGPETPIPELTFMDFIVSLSSSVAVHLGLVADPTTGRTDRNLALAKQTIDLLALLQEKTRGNLTEEEEKLFQSILFDLRLQFVGACK